MKKSVFVLILSLLAFSCGKESVKPTPKPPTPIPGPNPDVVQYDIVYPKKIEVTVKDINYVQNVMLNNKKQITDIKSEVGPSMSFTYKGSYLSKVSTKNSKQEINRIDAEYSGERIINLKEEVFDKGITIIEDYKYNNGKLSKVSKKTIDNNKPNRYVETSYFKYEGKTVEEETTFIHNYPGRNPIIKKSKKTYTFDSSNRLVELVYIEIADGYQQNNRKSSVISSYRYDGKGNVNYNNPIFDLRPTHFLNPYAQLNNLTKIIENTTNSNGDIDKKEVNMSYKYHTNEYPSQVEKTDFDGSKTKSVYTY